MLRTLEDNASIQVVQAVRSEYLRSPFLPTLTRAFFLQRFRAICPGWGREVGGTGPRNLFFPIFFLGSRFLFKSFSTRRPIFRHAIKPHVHLELSLTSRVPYARSFFPHPGFRRTRHMGRQTCTAEIKLAHTSRAVVQTGAKEGVGRRTATQRPHRSLTTARAATISCRGSRRGAMHGYAKRNIVDERRDTIWGLETSRALVRTSTDVVEGDGAV